MFIGQEEDTLSFLTHYQMTKVLEWSKLKAFADDKTRSGQKTEILL